ncbi:hypothetical protein [Erythrobacter sp. MTPC3]|uniref:hypothetical protein n=1 Tax=Erythrobacter sp. MTPC3 TaxID=3056564 RepID=UPI0036F21FBA
MFLLILVLAIAAAVYIFSQTSAAEIAKDTAITDAAGEVGGGPPRLALLQKVSLTK